MICHSDTVTSDKVGVCWTEIFCLSAQPHLVIMKARKRFLFPITNRTVFLRLDNTNDSL